MHVPAHRATELLVLLYTIRCKGCLTHLSVNVVNRVDLARCSLDRVEEGCGQGILSVVKIRELHDLEVGVIATSENRREVGGRLSVTGKDRQQAWGRRRPSGVRSCIREVAPIADAFKREK